jgi:hypothetical protein
LIQPTVVATMISLNNIGYTTPIVKDEFRLR